MKSNILKGVGFGVALFIGVMAVVGGVMVVLPYVLTRYVGGDMEANSCASLALVVLFVLCIVIGLSKFSKEEESEK